jgi:Streptomyces sporulation and cell division protein, SsgA
MPLPELSSLQISENMDVDIHVVRDLCGNYWPPDKRTVELRFYREHPCSIFMLFDDAVIWEFSRDMLWEGLHEAVGDGHVEIFTGPPRTYFYLHPPAGEFAFEMGCETLRSFIQWTEHHVPRGAETGLMGLDAALDLILKEQ